MEKIFDKIQAKVLEIENSTFIELRKKLKITAISRSNDTRWCSRFNMIFDIHKQKDKLKKLQQRTNVKWDSFIYEFCKLCTSLFAYEKTNFIATDR